MPGPTTSLPRTAERAHASLPLSAPACWRNEHRFCHRRACAMRVLVAEDDVRLAAVLAQALGEAGWEVETVGDGPSAYSCALPGGNPYDVLLLDWMLPGLDGVTV